VRRSAAPLPICALNNDAATVAHSHQIRRSVRSDYRRRRHDESRRPPAARAARFW